MTPITDLLTDTAIAQPSQTQTEIRIDTDRDFTWVDAAKGIESGSWAVVLTIGILWLVARKPLSRAFENQMALMSALKENLGKITATQETMTTHLEKAQNTIDKVAANDSHVAEVLTSLSDTSSDHSNAIVKILTSIESNQKGIVDLASNKTVIEERQKQQIELLKKIDSKLEQPIDVHPVAETKETR